MLIVTYEDFKRTNNMLKTNFHNSGLHNRIVTIENVKNGLATVKSVDKQMEWQEPINHIVEKCIKGMVCLSNPSVLQNWQGFLKENTVSNVNKKQQMQAILLRTIAEDLADSQQTFEAICVLKFGLDKQDIQKMRMGNMPKYNEALYKNIMKYILSCNCEAVNSKLIRQGIVLSN